MIVYDLIDALTWALAQIEDDLDPDHQESLVAAHAALKAAQRSIHPDLVDALLRVMRHIPADAGGCSLADDMRRARAAIRFAQEDNHD